MSTITTSLTRMTTFPFDDTYDLINFLYSNSAIGTWEVEIARLSAIDGMTLELNTTVRNYQGQVKYLPLNNIKSLINNFLDNNEYMQINVEFKLKYPDAQRHIMDITDAYSAFWLNCYSDSTSNTAYAMISYLETARELPVEPITSWAVYIHSLYNNYINSSR